MSKVTQPPDIGRIKDQPEFNRNAAIVLSDIVSAINGNLDFSTNINCVTVSGTTSAGVQVTVTHTLGRVPQGKIVISQNSNAVIQDANRSGWTSDKIYIVCADSGDFSLILI